MLYLEITTDDQTTHELPLANDGEIRIGRTADNTVCIDADGIGETHAAFGIGREGVYVRDLGSGLPTLLNDAPVGQAWITPRDRVRIGPVVIRIEERLMPAAAPTAAGPTPGRLPGAHVAPVSSHRKARRYDSGTGSAIVWLLVLVGLVWAGWQYRNRIREQLYGNATQVVALQPPPAPPDDTPPEPTAEPTPETAPEPLPEPSPEPPPEPESTPPPAVVRSLPSPTPLPPPARTVKAPTAKARTARLFHVGGPAETTLSAAHALSNGDILVSGSTSDLAWTGSAPRTEWRIPETTGFLAGEGATHGFVLLLSPDLTTIKHVYYFPKGPITGINRIRSTEVPGNPTGAVYLSGSFASMPGYWIARLDSNFVNGSPTGPVWLKEIRAGGDHQSSPRWDVRSDGQVIYVSGTPYSHSWSGLGVLDGSTGETGRMPDWPHEAGKPLLPLKAARENSLRSKTQEDFDHRQEDENDNPGRKGRYPDDYYFQGPGLGGPGYTGYRLGANPTQRVSQIAIDRRNNHLYFGYSTQTRLPNGFPDFEPAFVAMTDTGKLLWWARGYREIERKGKEADAPQDSLNSPPDQYVDNAAIDYVNNQVVFAARCHGNGVINFWPADQIKRNKAKRGFQSRFTGRNGNIHIGWLGKYGLLDGKIYASTYVAELAEGSTGKPARGRLRGWPDPNEGWMDVNTTRIGFLEVDHLGRPHILAVGRRPFTTSNALIENVPPGKGVSAWAPFARIYDSKLTDLDYSTILRGPWDTKTGQSTDDKVELTSLTPLDGGLLVTGIHRSGATHANTQLPTVNVPAWGSAKIPGPASAILALLPEAAAADPIPGVATPMRPAGLSTRFEARPPCRAHPTIRPVRSASRCVHWLLTGTLAAPSFDPNPHRDRPGRRFPDPIPRPRHGRRASASRHRAPREDLPLQENRPARVHLPPGDTSQRDAGRTAPRLSRGAARAPGTAGSPPSADNQTTRCQAPIPPPAHPPETARDPRLPSRRRSRA